MIRARRPRATGPILVAVLVAGAAACSGGDDDAAPPADTAGVATTADPPAGGTTPATTPPTGPADDPATTSAPTDPAATPPPATALVEDPDQVTDEGEGTDAGDPQPGGVLRVGLAADGTGFNTMSAIAPGSIRVVNAVSDGLMTVDATGQPAPLLAAGMSASDDLMTWTIELRPDVRFHDGAPVDAEAVRANLDAFRASPSVGYGMSQVTEIVAVDELTVEVRMNAPWSAFDSYLTGQPGWVVSPATIGSNETFVGTGPFVLESWTPGAGARVVRNDDYWRDGMPYLDAIEFTFVPDSSVRRQALESGDLDVYISPNDGDIVEFLDDDAVDVWIGEASSNEALFVLNTAQPPFDDLRVRRAMAFALDRELMVEVLRSGLTTPASGPVNPNSPWYVETDYPGFDMAEAQRLVAEYEAEIGPVQVTLKGEPTPDSQELRDLAVSFWEEAGIEVTQEEIGLGASVTAAITDDYQVIAWAQFSAIDPDGERSFFRSGGPLNWSNLESARIDAALDAGRATDDPDARFEAYAEFQRALAEELPMIWVDHLNGVEAVAAQPTVHGIAERTLPDGEPGIGLLAGSFFSFEDVWMEQ